MLSFLFNKRKKGESRKVRKKERQIIFSDYCFDPFFKDFLFIFKNIQN